MTMECTTVAGWTKKTAAVGLAALLSAGVAVAQQKPVAPAATKVAVVTKPMVEEEETAATPKKPGSEGVKVHGHWVIDLKDKDGKLIEHRDFQNAIDSNAGTTAFAALLTGLVVPSTLMIDATQVTPNPTGLGATGTSYRLYLPNVGTLGNCHEATNGVYNSGGSTIYCLPQMTQTYVPPQVLSGGLFATPTYSSAAVVLSGQFVAQAPINISSVSTYLATCSGQPFNQPSSISSTGVLTPVSPIACQQAAPVGFQDQELHLTGTGITPLAVATGQQLSITVTLTFS